VTESLTLDLVVVVYAIAIMVVFGSADDVVMLRGYVEAEDLRRGIDFAETATSALRGEMPVPWGGQSNIDYDFFWNQVRRVIVEEGCDPSRAAVGDGPFSAHGDEVYTLCEDGHAFELVPQMQPFESGDEPRLILIAERTALRTPTGRTRGGWACYYAAEVLRSRGAAIEPLSYLAESVEDLSIAIFGALDRERPDAWNGLSLALGRAGYSDTNALFLASNRLGPRGYPTAELLLAAEQGFMELRVVPGRRWTRMGPRRTIRRLDAWRPVGTDEANEGLGAVAGAALLVASQRGWSV
jgi:hypothetical protein